MKHVLYLDLIRAQTIDHAIFANDDLANILSFELCHDPA